jgi:hypothetical protein
MFVAVRVRAPAPENIPRNQRRMAYRFFGKQKSLALGKYPQTSLLEARRDRDEAKRLLAKGADPSLAKRAKKRARLIAAGNTFRAVAEEWFEANSERWVQSCSSRLWGRLDCDLLPALASRPIAQITPLEILDVTDQVAAHELPSGEDSLVYLLVREVVGMGISAIVAARCSVAGPI